ncbi:MAG: hypothetical protein WCW16_02170 [Candidatus Magasanikbacteria bacterium]
MNKKIIIFSIIIIIVTILAGGIYKVVSLNQKISYYKNKEAEDYFKKKLECGEMAAPIKEELQKYNSGPLSLFVENFEMVFYSPKENSCIYSIERLYTGDQPEREYVVYNALTKHKITSFQFPSQWENYKSFLLEYSNGEIRL